MSCSGLDKGQLRAKRQLTTRVVPSLNRLTILLGKARINIR